MRFEVLGPLSVSNNGEAVPLGGRKQRTLLAVLLLHASQPVSRARLVDALWAEQRPASWAESLDSYLYRLRRLLGHDRLSHEAGGYLLHVEPDELDAYEFEQLVTSATAATEAGDHDEALTDLTGALSLWRGPAWGDLLDDDALQADARRLEELRLNALESRFEAELALGHGAELAPQLERLVDEHRSRERLVASLMLALYRAGRQTDALDAFTVARRHLVDEFALEPGRELHALQRRMLEHDPTLGVPHRLAPPSGAPRARSLAIAVPAAIAALVVGVLVLSGGAAGHPRGLAPGDGGLVAVDATSGRVASATPLAGDAGSVTASGRSVWVADPAGELVYQVDPDSASVVDRIPVGAEPGSIVSGDGAVWVVSTVGSTVTRIDPDTDTMAPPIDLPGANPGAIAYGAGRLWVADAVDRELFEIDPATDALERTSSLDLQPSAIATGFGAIWVAGYDKAAVEKIDPASGKVIGRVHVGDGPVALAFGSGSLWVANSLDSTVFRIHPANLRVTAKIAVGSGPTALATGDGSVWVANQYSGTVSRIDTRHHLVAATTAISGAPTSLTVSGGHVWVGVAADGGSHRDGTLVLVTPGPVTSSNPMSLASVDPAFYNQANNPQFTGLAYDTLVNFEQSPGSNGLRLVPDLAVSIPTPSNGGTTYTFRIRPGIRYSDGQLLRAGDFRRAFERLFRVGSPGVSLFEDVVGSRGCIRAPHTCNLSRGIVTNDTTGAVTFHLSAPDPDFLLRLTEFAFAAPIPPGTPDHERGRGTVPGTGPYKIASVSDTQVRFVRNPFFHEWSHAAQPDGNPNSIVWRSVPTARAGVTAIERGRADWLFGQIPAAQYRQLELEDPAELHSNPEFAVEFVPLNTNRAPFNNLKVRQAFNYAINRARIVQLNGGTSFASPTCQLIAPGLPGYRRYCPYTMHPRPDGVWSAPNMKRARQLVGQSGTRGERIDLWGSPDGGGFVPTTMPEYLAGVLSALGYRVHLHLIPTASLTEAMHRSFQLSADGDWLAAYPFPSSYVPSFVSCGGGTSNGYFCNPSLDREMQEAGLAELDDPSKASELWESIDRRLTNQAVWVPTVTQRDIEITSRRLQNYQYSPVSGFLADQSWLR